MNNKLTAIVFDVEGTLIDCVPHVLESWQKVLESHGHAFELKTLQRYSGMDGADMLDRLLPDEAKETKKKLLEEQGQRYRHEYLDRGRPFGGVHNLFAGIKREGMSIGIATTCRNDELTVYDRHMQVLRMTDAVACGDEAKQGKPHPDIYRLVLRKLGLAEPLCAMAVGDSVYDAIAAKALGLQVTGLLSGGFSHEDLTSAGCSLVLGEVKDLAGHLVSR